MVKRERSLAVSQRRSCFIQKKQTRLAAVCYREDINTGNEVGYGRNKISKNREIEKAGTVG